MIVSLKDGSLKVNTNYSETSILLQLTDRDGSQTRVLLTAEDAVILRDILDILITKVQTNA